MQLALGWNVSTASSRGIGAGDTWCPYWMQPALGWDTMFPALSKPRPLHPPVSPALCPDWLIPREFRFTSEVPIWLDYHGKHVTMDQVVSGALGRSLGDPPRCLVWKQAWGGGASG